MINSIENYDQWAIAFPGDPPPLAVTTVVFAPGTKAMTAEASLATVRPLTEKAGDAIAATGIGRYCWYVDVRKGVATCNTAPVQPLNSLYLENPLSINLFLSVSSMYAEASFLVFVWG
jgi:hypothetical protein